MKLYTTIFIFQDFLNERTRKNTIFPRFFILCLMRNLYSVIIIKISEFFLEIKFDFFEKYAILSIM